MDINEIYAWIIIGYFVVSVLAIILCVLLFLKNRNLRRKYGPLTDLHKSIEAFKAKARSEGDEIVRKLNKSKSKLKELDELIEGDHYLVSLRNHHQKYGKIVEIEKRIDEIKQRETKELAVIKNKVLTASRSLTATENQIQSRRCELKVIISEIEDRKPDYEALISGFTDIDFEFDDHPAYVVAIKALRERQKTMIRNKSATKYPENITLHGSLKDGRKAIADTVKLALRAFNNEADLLIKNVTWKNADRTKERIRKISKDINNLTQYFEVEIRRRYVDLKVEEVNLAYQEKIKKEEEKERLRQQREAEREEAKARREIANELKRQEKYEKEKERALAAARERLRIASEEHRAALESEIAEIESELGDMLVEKGRLLSMAEQTRIGHIYVISNRGSFGEEVVKIGMTRRLEPMDRVKELGDASVPFPFDVHAIVFSEDAPDLERKLHARFKEHRVNKINNRKEFFRVNKDDLEAALNELLPGLPFTKESPSLEFVQSNRPDHQIF